MDDAALLRRACKGHEGAFCELYERYQRKIHQYASRMCGNAAADDVVQETFLAVLNATGFDASKGTVAAYVFGIARHHVIRRLAERGEQLSEVTNVESIEAATVTPFETVARAEQIVALRTAIQTLPALYREVVVLCDLQEMDYAVAAEVIDVPIGTIRSRLHRARALLASAMAEHWPHTLRRTHG